MFRAFFIALSKSKRLKKLAVHNGMFQRFARRFVAGHTLEETLPVVQRLNQQGITVTMDHLGEHVTQEEEARKSAEEACRIYDFLQKHQVKGSVSIKLTQMGLGLDEGLCYENVDRILLRAQETNSFLRIDMEDSQWVDKTLELFFHFREKTDKVGIVLQAYLYRTPQDMEAVLSRKGTIRLCKGAYKEAPDVAFPKKKQVNQAYVELMKKLLDTPLYHAMATHDEAMIQATKEYAKQIGRDPQSFEFQMLYGIRRERQRTLVKEGHPLRVYVPYGWEWYPYFMRRLAERPANVFFVLRHLFGK